MNEKFSIPHEAASCGIENFSFIVSELVQVNPDNSRAMSALTCNYSIVVFKGAVYILHSKISTDPGLLKIRHSHRFVAVVIQILISLLVFYPGSLLYVLG